MEIAIAAAALLVVTGVSYALGLMVGRQSARPPQQKMPKVGAKFEPRLRPEIEREDTPRVSRASMRRTR